MISRTTGWKAFRIDSNGQLRFLFHAYKAPGAVRSSSIVPLDKWIETKRPWGREAKGRKYRVAFHFLKHEHHIDGFQRLTKNKYIMLPIRARNVEPKPRTAVGSWLAKSIFVSSAELKKALGEFNARNLSVR